MTQMGQALWLQQRFQVQGAKLGAVQGWSRSQPRNSSSPTFKFHSLADIFISLLLQAPPADNLSGVVSLAPDGTATLGSK